MIAYDKKKYLDLKTAYLEQKNQIKLLEEELFMSNPDLQ